MCLSFESVGKQATGHARLTQRVVDTGRVIADRLWSPRTDKDRSGVLGHLPDLDCVLHLQDQVLGCIVVAQLHGLFDGLDDKGNGVVDGATDNVDTRQSVCLAVELVFDGLQFVLGEVNSDENNLGVDTVLGLREKV